jgi:hypothetical protein
VTAQAAAQQRQPSDAAFLRAMEQRLQQLDSRFRLTVPADQPISERVLLDYGGSLRFAFVASDDDFGSTRILRQSDATLYLRAELDGAHRFFGRLRFLYDDFNNGDSFDGRGDEFRNPIGDRWWYQFDLRGHVLAERGERLDWNVNAKVGRQFVQWGSGLALSNVMYAGLVDLEAGDLSLQGLAGITPSSSTIDFDATRPAYDVDTERRFYGARLEYRGFAKHRPSVSALIQRDANDQDRRVFPTPVGPIETEFDYDSEYFTIGSRGTLSTNWLYRTELIHQRGCGLSSPINPQTGFPEPQTEEDIRAWAGVLTLTNLLHNEADTRFEIEFAGGSGDSDRGHPSNTFAGNRSGTVDRAFNGLGFINTGLALAPGIANLLMLRGGVRHTLYEDLNGSGRLRLGVDAFLFGKADSGAPISVSTVNETFVGGEIDIGAEWRISSDISVDLRYGVFLPGDAMLDGQDDPRHFFYLGVLYAF